MEILHYPVLHEPVLEYLALSTDEEAVMIDCTTGEGGHSNLFLSRFPRLHVIGIDRDKEIQKKAIERLSIYGERFTPVNAWFDDYLKSAESSSADRILFDLGISTFHYEESRRGFSFRKDERLDMRLNENATLSAATIVNTYAEEELADLIYRKIRHKSSENFVIAAIFSYSFVYGGGFVSKRMFPETYMETHFFQFHKHFFRVRKKLLVPQRACPPPAPGGCGRWPRPVPAAV